MIDAEEIHKLLTFPCGKLLLWGLGLRPPTFGVATPKGRDPKLEVAATPVACQ